MKQTITLILAVYVIVYVCITIYNKPNLEFFYAEETTSTATDISLSGSTEQTLDEATKIFMEQESEQNIQNKSIRDLKKRVDTLRNDIVILKNKEKDEYRNIYNKIGMEDSVSQIPDSVKDRLGLGLPSEIDFNFTIDPTL